MLERLFESKGTGDMAWRRTLSREADVILESDVEASAGAIVGSFWHVPGMAPDSGTPTEWLSGLAGAIVNVQCHCPPRVCANRFLARSRHVGHLDGSRTLAEILASIEALVPFGPLTLGVPVVVDTSGDVEAAAVVRDVRAALARSRSSC
jgi:hypothetical protein